MKLEMKLESIRDLFRMELRDLYGAEQLLLAALPKLRKAATAKELRGALAAQREQTQGHLVRLDRIFDTLGESPKGRKCLGIEGIIAESGKVRAAQADGPVRDAALLGAVQRAVHYQIAAYGCLKAYALLLGDPAAVALAAQALGEEQATDQKLTALAEEIVNPRVARIHGRPKGPARRRRTAAARPERPTGQEKVA